MQLCTWPEVEAYLERSTGIIQPIGSTEQHGPTGFIAIADEVFGDAEGFHATPSEVALTYYGYPDDAARVKKNKLIPKRAPQGPIYDAEDYRRRFPDGRIGSDPSLATEEIGERLLESAVAELSADYQAFLAAT